ncbi:MAG TPA: hypothetical protein VGM30_06040 [Puia sp.]|jgi:hypothetical protein
MMQRYILLSFLLVSCCCTRAQFKIGLTAGYEHITTNPNDYSNSGGGLCGGLQLHYALSPHWEIQGEFTGGHWKSEPFSFSTAGNIMSSRYVTVRGGTTQFRTPIHLCYVIPLEKVNFFAGAGVFWSSLWLTGGFENIDISYIGGSLLTGIRRGLWQLSVDYCPWFHNYKELVPVYYNFNTRFTNNVAVKVGFVFGESKKKAGRLSPSLH